ncbi:Signal transduction histidine kinase [Thermomonospora echinospora]|uniref:histidine kinase n=1 Tax=Thermomonospora echinospora TaxID=1992 RepID=A0A1H5WYI5_9ACTN|nr:ATP-binding protein [Thermomonospora echinospora]SEG04373.1 Signal transduction histidine kinase [Thermomonospora echinospora]
MNDGLWRRLRPTIRVRLTLWYGGLFLAAGVVLLGVTYMLVAQNLHGQQTIATKVMAPDIKIMQVPSSPDAAARTGPDASAADPEPDQRFRKLLINAEQDYRQATLNALVTQGGIGLALVSTVAVGLGWLMADRALRPVHRVTETARRVAQSHNLTERIAYDGPRDDVKELADTFDVMLARLARAFEAQRRFVDNASHELRTPLAINRTLVDVAVRRPDATEDVRRLGESLLVVNARHERLIDGLLTLAGSENAVTDRTPLDLADVAGHVLDLAEVEAAERGVTVHRALGQAPTAGDPVLLERLVQNLVENAVRHNAAKGGELWLATRWWPHFTELVVANTGPVVPPYEIETIFEPFRRLRGDRVRSDRGAGLGLSIVRAIATAHGGHVTALPREGGGLTVTVRLPGRQPAGPHPGARSGAREV